MIEAVGDRALVWGTLHMRPGLPRHDVVLVGPKGPLLRTEGVDPGLDQQTIAQVRWLADPPRLAVLRRRERHGRSVTDVDIIDVATGQVQETYADNAVTHIAAWSPSGQALFAHDAFGACLVRAGGVKARIGAMERPAHRAWFSADETRAIAIGALDDDDDDDDGGTRLHRLAAFDLVDGARDYAITIAAHAVHVNDDCTAFAVDSTYELGFYDADTLARAEELAGNARTMSYVEVEHPRVQLASIRRVWADAKLERFVVAGPDASTRAPVVATIERTGLAFDVVHRVRLDVHDVDVARGLALAQRTDGVALHDASGAERAFALRGVRPVFTGGRAACLVDGALHELRDGGSVVVEGPANLVDIGPHARGVIALDDERRVHVLELPP